MRRDGSFDGPVVLDEAALMRLSKYQLESDPDEVDVDLVCSLVKHVHEKNRAKPDGAILVFLPGWDEISKIKDALSHQAGLTDVQIMPLHSMVFRKTNAKCFKNHREAFVKLCYRRTSRKRRSLLTTSYTSSILENSKRKDTTRTAVSTLHQTWISSFRDAKKRSRRSSPSRRSVSLIFKVAVRSLCGVSAPRNAAFTIGRDLVGK